MDGPAQDPLEVMQRVVRSIAAWAAAANMSGAVVIFVYLQFLSTNAAVLAATPRNVRIVAVVFFLYTSSTLVLGTVAIARYAGRWVGWLVSGAPPTQAEHRRTLQLPAFCAGTFLVLWLGAAVVFGVLNLFLGYRIVDGVRVAVGIVFAGLVTSAIGFLVVERAFRPAIAAALLGREETVSSAGLGVRARLGLAWAVGSGVPLVGIGLAAATIPRVGWEVKVPIISLVVLGLVAGFIMTRGTARAVAEPLERVRTVVEAVRLGDLEASVTVDDGGEVGLLQIGINRMVEATRERLRVQELFGRHVGEAVARRAVEGDDALGGLATSASVLFADVIQSTALARSLPPTAVVDLLNEFFRCVVEATAAEGGLVNKFEGDGALCVFGPPGGEADHAARALAAARRLRALLAETPAGVAGLDAAIGVSTGQAVAGNVGAADRFEYTVIGDPVNEASRLTDLAKLEPGRVLASGATIAAAGSAEGRRWQHIGSVELRGRGAPTQLFVPVDGPSSGDVVRSLSEPAPRVDRIR